MLKLTRYVAKTVLVTTAIVTLSIMAIFIIFTFIAQMEDVGQGNYTSVSAFIYVLYELPVNLYLIMPMACLLGSLMGLGILANNSELIVMRAAGCSTFQISKGVMVASSILVVFCFMLGSWLGPSYTQKAEIHKAIAQGGNNAVISGKQSLWFKSGNDFIHVNGSLAKHELVNITRFRIKDGQLKTIIEAQNATLDGNTWIISDVNETSLSFDQVSVTHLDKDTWKNLIPPRLVDVLGVNPEYLNIKALWEYMAFKKQNAEETNALELQFWQKFFQPISVIILMLMAVPFVFGPMRSAAMGLKILAGLLLGFIFFIINQFFGPFSEVYNLPGLIGAGAPTVIFTIILIILFVKMRE
ncbi:LPS export ABC transporter permease LptG [Thiotrichales bacterium 19S9-12]|nr:LPS export ABC transporter permease LptG [Thiotrichales bacterium 19S9-11]MCF6812573.1 LPS export ABC transporter permease LptG [Thiotrichales bacterium 19S9-12]